MKKFFSGLVAGVMLASTIALAATYVAETATFKVLVNGEEFVSDPPALVVEGRTYLPLRAMGDALGVPVEWNEELGQAEVGTTPENTAEPQYKSYSGYEGIIDFGDFAGIEPCYDVIDTDTYIEYIYDYNEVPQNAVSDYLLYCKDNGYTLERDGTTKWLVYNAEQGFILKTGRAFTDSADLHVMIILVK